jgi:MOSC domain-containing protein
LVEHDLAKVGVASSNLVSRSKFSFLYLLLLAQSLVFSTRRNRCFIMFVSQLFTYPVKSFQGNFVQSMELDEFGPQGDRRFMVVDASGKFITQRTHPQMAKVHSCTDGDLLELRLGESNTLSIVLGLFATECVVQVWGEHVAALRLLDSSFDSELSTFLGADVHLVYMPKRTLRLVDPAFSRSPSRVSFADGFPFLLCNEASLVDLNARLEEPVPMGRFRPNVVISGSQPFAESNWSSIKIGEVVFDLVKPCSRCSMITLDLHGRFSKEPLKTLATYRANSFGACFGENMIHRGVGMIALGMSVEILE